MTFTTLARDFEGELYYDNSAHHRAQKTVYATDASVYQEMPQAVAVPKNINDIKKLILFANTNHITLIPRAAGTSLAGQVVGNGIVIDISKYFKRIIELNVAERWVKVEPGIIRDDLNAYLKPYGLMFAPETSTANRAMIGGMIGNNSCGLHSIVWGDTRRHLIEAKVLLHDGSEVVLQKLSKEALSEKAKNNTTEGNIYTRLTTLLNNKENQLAIQNGYPKKSLTRRNTGYALDILLDELQTTQSLNLCHLIAGSEGTLGFVTEAKLNLLSLPPVKEALVCVHCSTLAEALHASNVALRHHPMASELVDKYIMDFTKGHRAYSRNRFFIEGDPEALLMIEFMEADEDLLEQKTRKLVEDLQQHQLGYAYPIIKGTDTKLAWDIRKAGLGLIRNMPGDKQPVNLIEDCAVSPEDLPDYIADLKNVLTKYNLTASYYAHAGAGELHVEPMINLKTREGQQTFRAVLQDTAALVKKYNGSLSGEHGDGRLRGEFIPFVLGSKVYELLQEVKNIFDPKNIFNAGKIVDTPAMNKHLRYEADSKTRDIQTIFNFTVQEGILKLTEKCSGSGDCRRSHLWGTTMCPSYMATLQEKDTTRARANILRQFLTQSNKENPFDHPEIKEVMDLCLSCKGCKSECPSSVDVAKLKAEFLQHYYDANGIPLRTRIIAGFTQSQQLATKFAPVYNALLKNNVTGKITKRFLGFAPKRSLPLVSRVTLRQWFKQHPKNHKQSKRQVLLFCDEFTNYNDVQVGHKAVLLLEALGYEVLMPPHDESGRTYLSKGLLRKAKSIILKNVATLSPLVNDDTPLIGIEPSALLTFRDEALDLTNDEQKEAASHLAKNSFLIEEFLLREFQHGNITSEHFTSHPKHIKLHGHCYQKSFGLVDAVKNVLSIPTNYSVEVIPSGCCGMAGSFGYEKEHYDTSMKIGELVLFPEVRKTDEHTVIAASGTSCRHQIKDGTGRKSLHPVEILWEALL
ncbi:MAG: FAD-linked oxidase C-terminal domain-containing protein [Niabella sp.]